MMLTMNTLWFLWNCQIVSSNFLAFSPNLDLWKSGRKVVFGYTINFVIIKIFFSRLHELNYLSEKLNKAYKCNFEVCFIKLAFFYVGITAILLKHRPVENHFTRLENN
jgi:hypothetical protein